MTPALNRTVADVYRGFFWLPAQPELRLRGTLTFTNEGASLRVEGVLSPTMRRDTSNSSIVERYEIVTPDLWPQDVLIHGALDDHDGRQHQENVSLMRSMCVSQELGPLAELMTSGVDHQTWQPTEILRGGHIDGGETTFTSIRVRLQHIEEWSALKGFSRKIVPGDRIEVTCTSIPSPRVTVFEDATLSLVAEFEVDGPSAVEGAVRRTLWFQVEGLRPSTVLELDRAIVAPLRALLTLCTGHDCGPCAVKVGPWSDFPWLDLTHPGIDHAPQDLLKSRDMILDLEHIGIEGVGRWIDASEGLGPIPHKVASVIIRRGNVIENDFHDLATAAEGLHRRLHMTTKRFTKGRVEKARKVIKEHLGILDQEIYEATCLAIAHIRDPSYKARLTELLSAAASCVPGVAGEDSETWKTLVGKFRDRFAHELDHGTLDREGVEQLIVLKESLAWLLTARMLLVTGATPELLAPRISAHPRYTPFVRQARTLLPAVYGCTGRSDRQAN